MDTQSLIERLCYRVNNPSAWSEFEQSGSDLCATAAYALASQAAEIERMMESLSEAIRLFKSKRLALNSQYEAVDVLREDGVYSIVIADLEEIRVRAALDGEKP